MTAHDEDEIPTPKVTLGKGDGAEDFRVIDQPHAYLLPRIDGVLRAMFGDESNLTAERIALSLGDGVYDALTGFLPDLPKRIKRWHFLGYATREDMESGAELDPDTVMRTPSLPQIANAIDTGIEVNGKEVLEKIFLVVDPLVLREIVGDRLKAWNDASVLRTWLSSQRTSGESDQTNSGDEPETDIQTDSE